MVAKSNAEKKFIMKHIAKFGTSSIPKIAGRQNHPPRVIFDEDLKGRWFPVPEDKQNEFLAELRAAGKDRREGKPIDSPKWNNYFTEANSVAKGRKKLYKLRSHANWDEVFKTYKEVKAASLKWKEERAKAASLKRKEKRAKAASLKRKEKRAEAYKRKKEQF